MSGLLKSGSAALAERVRPLGAPLTRAAVKVDTEMTRLRGQIDALAAELAMRDEAISAHAAELEISFSKGEADGRAAGRKEAEDHSAKALALVESAAEQAAARFDEELKAMERLAALVARTCLERMLLASDERVEIVVDLIRQQVAALGDEAAIRLEVSPEDFDCADALARLSVSLAGRMCEIVASEGLRSGDCTIALRLGAIDVGLDQQWSSLRAALDAMIDGRVPG
jgi:flagellar biosynthesis/type III secretory pathway protein FliH